MENKTNWVLIIGIVVVVAIVASLATLQFTGNVINMTNPDRSACYSECKATSCADVPIKERGACYRQCSADCRYVDIYTKDEVDALLADVGGNSGSGSVDFSQCGPTTGLSSADTGNQACAKEGKSCVFGKIYLRHLVGVTISYDDGIQIESDKNATLVPGHHLLINCDDTMKKYFEMYSTNVSETGVKTDIDPAWLCC